MVRKDEVKAKVFPYLALRGHLPYFAIEEKTVRQAL